MTCLDVDGNVSTVSRGYETGATRVHRSSSILGKPTKQIEPAIIPPHSLIAPTSTDLGIPVTVVEAVFLLNLVNPGLNKLSKGFPGEPLGLPDGY